MTPATNSFQFLAFLQMLYVGALIGLIYDVTQYALAGVLKNSVFADLLFWIGAVAVTLGAMFRAANLSVRLYLIGGIIAGWALYALAISPLFRKICDVLREALARHAAKSKVKARAKLDRFLIKNKKTIGKINLTAKKMIDIPLKLKKGYNRYVKYFSNFKGPENAQQRTEEKEN
jgi:hypothetical protein